MTGQTILPIDPFAQRSVPRFPIVSLGHIHHHHGPREFTAVPIEDLGLWVEGRAAPFPAPIEAGEYPISLLAWGMEHLGMCYLPVSPQHDLMGPGIQIGDIFLLEALPGKGFRQGRDRKSVV